MPDTEFSLIERYFSRLGNGAAVDLGVGDDCALVRVEEGERLAVSIDTLVEGVHFLPSSPPADVGFRAVAAAASDLAATGARPLAMTLALSLPAADARWLAAFSAGLAEAAQDLDLPLAGGDTTRGPLSVSVQVMGAVPEDAALLRSGARVGDDLFVSGTLGDAAAGLAVIRGEWQPDPDVADAVVARFYRPSARLDLGRELLHRASAAIDISDGLLADAGHIARASGVGIEIETGALPLSSALRLQDPKTALRWALAGGDDYELCFCLPAGELPPRGCTRIGQVVAGEGVHCDREFDIAPGYQHFSEQPS